MSSNLFEHPDGEAIDPNIPTGKPESDNEGESSGLEGISDIELPEDEERAEPFFLSSDDENEFEAPAPDTNEFTAADNGFGGGGFGLSDDDGADSDEDFDGDDYRDALRDARGFRSKNRKRKRNLDGKNFKRRQMRSKESDPEVRELYSKANVAFVEKDFPLALNLYREVIRKDNRNFSAYKTLGEIYKHQGKLNECCNYWFLAANINQKDWELWSTVGQLSEQLGHIDQALYSYRMAIKTSNGEDFASILARARIYKERKQYGRALEGFQKVHVRFPTDTGVIKDLASVYVEQKRSKDAIKLYMDVLDKNINSSEEEREDVANFSWSELNILLELNLSQHNYDDGIRILKLSARWIQQRLSEVWWDENDDDSEFDARRFQVLEKRPYNEQIQARDKNYELPIDIRFKLGALRLGLGDKDEAMLHFEYIKIEENVEDLYWEAGVILESNGYYSEALTYLSMCNPESHDNSIQLVSLLGKCNQEVGDYQEAARSYQTVLADDPKNLEIKLALAEVYYHLGAIEESQSLLKEVGEEAHGDGRGGDFDNFSSDEHQVSTGVENDGRPAQVDLGLIKNKQVFRSKSSKPSDAEKLEQENNAKRKVLEKYHRMERLEPSVLGQERVAVTAWMRLASQLVEMFSGVSSFFPRDKNREFKGIVLYRRKKEMGIDEKMARVLNLHEGIAPTEAGQQSRSILTSKTEYRGLDYHTWFKIFVQYALLLAKFESNLEDAIEVIQTAADVSVFVQDKNKEMVLKMVRLMFGIAQGDVQSTVMTYVRFFLSANQFSPYVYKFFMCCFASSAESWETFSNYNHQKFFLRQLKAFDSILNSQKHISGMATLTADVKNMPLSKREHAELLYVYANLLGGSRSYVSSIVYLNRAYKHYNQDPMICLVLGLAHVHRSMQRLSSNRHMQLLQGISYILQYREHRRKNSTVYELQEIEYNFGRLFHMLGLTTLAVNSYDKVLEYHDVIEDEDYDLSMEAAYNLTLIYNISGNSNLARKITEKYLVI